MVSRNTRIPYIAKAAVFTCVVYALVIFPGGTSWISHWDTEDAIQYLKEGVKQSFDPPGDPRILWNGEVGDKVVVMAKTPEEDTEWVQRELPDWQRAIYSTSPSSNGTDLTIPANKGHEAMAYLTYIITHYATLPSTLLFLHAHESGWSAAWHVDAPLHSNPVAARTLQLPLVQTRGYVNLRCNPKSNCLHSGGWGRRHPGLLTREIWEALWANTSTPAPVLEELMRDRVTVDHADDPHKPDRTDSQGQDEATVGGHRHVTPPLADPAGAQFAVSREVIRKRPVDDYIALREWLLHTEESDRVSGRVFEYLWHVLFGMPGVLCYERRRCECEVFGRCG